MSQLKKPSLRALRARSMTADFLHSIGNAVTEFSLCFSYNGRRALWYHSFDIDVIRREWTRSRKQQQLRRLEERGLIKRRQTADKLEIALTKEGLHEYFRVKVHDADMLPEGKVCMVVFDIPERHRALRRKLRTFLESAAFIPIQRSVWITPFDAAKPLARLFKDLKDRCWIKVYTAEEGH